MSKVPVAVGGGLGLMSGLMAGDPAVNQIVQQQRLNEMQISGNKELANYFMVTSGSIAHNVLGLCDVALVKTLHNS